MLAGLHVFPQFLVREISVITTFTIIIVSTKVRFDTLCILKGDMMKLPYPAKLIYLNFRHLRLRLATAIHNLKCLKITHICFF